MDRRQFAAVELFLQAREQRLRRARQTRIRIAQQGVARLSVNRTNLHIAAQIASAEQQVLQADAQIAQVQAQASAAQAQVAQADAQLLRTKQDAERFGQLYTSQMKAVSKAELDAANAARSGAVADLAARKDSAVAAKAQIGAAQAARWCRWKTWHGRITRRAARRP